MIEHVPNPQLLIREFFRITKPGGQIYIDTPNIDAEGHQVFGGNWRGLEVPRHLVIFNWNSLEHLLSTSGLVRVKRRIRHEALRGMFVKSSLIAAGLDPENEENLNNVTRPSFVKNCRARLNSSRSEFVTITAKKPR